MAKVEDVPRFIEIVSEKSEDRSCLVLEIVGLCYLAKCEIEKGSMGEGWRIFSNAKLMCGFLSSVMAFNNFDHRKSVVSEIARANAVKGHLETYALKAEVAKYWNENIDPKISNEKAASILTKHFPLSHRKLSQYIAEEKKLLLASRA